MGYRISWGIQEIIHHRNSCENRELGIDNMEKVVEIPCTCGKNDTLNKLIFKQIMEE